jgi:ribosomal protein S18 acetylase RimI-like enzyme
MTAGEEAAMVRIEPYRDAHFSGVEALWMEAFPDDPPRNRAAAAIPEKLAVQPDLLLVALDGGELVGTAMAGYDGHRGWLYSVAVRRTHHRQGIGAMLVCEAEAKLTALGCRKVNLQVRSTNAAVVAFYRALGFEVEERISLGKRLQGRETATR